MKGGRRGPRWEGERNEEGKKFLRRESGWRWNRQ